MFSSVVKEVSQIASLLPRAWIEVMDVSSSFGDIVWVHDANILFQVSSQPG
jgi:hypothetical protein